MEITLKCGDCLDFMGGVLDKSISIAITDVPYGIGENSKKNASRTNLATALQ